ncbi:hypothetical protein J1N35_022442 [Gossypium stocksii]|uniref:Uncharacterized protein n=1 Tax=Gossypium stocksii TaxID=47602 RepID=A0A9D3VH76_9ROSI|nr:hypothetical protein J1N35_022442 [Gossypium stocksii]
MNFFHNKAFVKRGFNKILVLKIEDFGVMIRMSFERKRSGSFLLSTLWMIILLSQWDTVGVDVCKWDRGVLSDQSINKSINKTFLVLILKTKVPKSMAHF